MLALQKHSQISHQTAAFMARKFTSNVKQPTRSHELKSTDPMFMLLVRHGRQASERMHPKRVAMAKRASSIEGVMGYTGGRGD